jgi:glutamate N-acetyltransferase/amino-acid N-acetyltransferase
VFTQNRFPAAPVLLDREILRSNPHGIRAVVINAGNANACTGRQGEADARHMAALAETALGLPAGSALVMSTGVIGLPMAMDKVEAGVVAAASALSADPEAVGQAAQAIMTTDTRPKTASARAGRASLLGIAKGAGMIHPDMATLLACVVTDAAVELGALQAMLARAADRSFNAISVDGDTSTNDTLLALANGLAGATDMAALEAALTEVCIDLAQQIVRDGEGASKFVGIHVSGAESRAAARQVARTVATSLLVKTAIYGGDPNWGRVLAAAGRSGIELDPGQVALWFADAGGPALQVVAGGTPLAYDETEAARIFSGDHLNIYLDLGLGQATATVWTTDLGHGYVDINAHYRT